MPVRARQARHTEANCIFQNSLTVPKEASLARDGNSAAARNAGASPRVIPSLPRPGKPQRSPAMLNSSVFTEPLRHWEENRQCSELLPPRAAAPKPEEALQGAQRSSPPPQPAALSTQETGKGHHCNSTCQNSPA